MDYPIELKSVFFVKSIVVAIPTYSNNNNETLGIGPVNHIDVSLAAEETNEYAVAMKTLFNEESSSLAPYMIDMECIALFKVDSQVNRDEIIRRLTITGHSVLYGAIREAVSWITSRQPNGPLNLGLSVLKDK
jgi:preprotein translocase subunit SecB